MSTEKVGEKDNKKYFSRFLEAPLLRQVDGKLKKIDQKSQKVIKKKLTLNTTSETWNLPVDPITRTFRAKSMQHWCLFNMSNPRSMSIGCSSKIENEVVKKSSLIWICAMWTRPMIFWVPTPLAIPAHLLSTNRMILHLSAAAWDIIVAWAPESTKLEVINMFNCNERIETWIQNFRQNWFDFFLNIDHQMITYLLTPVAPI